MSWVFSEEVIFNLALWQVVLGAGFTLSLAIILWRYRNLPSSNRYHIWASAFFTIAVLPWLALWPAGSSQQGAPVEDREPHQMLAVQDHPAPAPGIRFNDATTQIGSTAIAIASNQPFAIAGNSGSVQVSPQPHVTTVRQAKQQPVPFNLETSLTSSPGGIANWSWRQEGLVLFFSLWAMVSLFLLVKLAMGLWQLRRLKRDSEPVSGPLASWFDQTLAQMNMIRKPVLKTHQTIGSPLVAGLFKPSILVPETLLNQLSGEALRQILLHELAHIKRWDDWVHLFQKAVLALFWFNPALHWLSRKMAWDRETACDQWAIARTGKSKQYAYSLLKVSESMRYPANGLLTVGAVRGKKQLTHRIESLLKPSASPSRLSTVVKILVGLLFTGCLASMAVAGPKLVMLQNSDSEPIEEKKAIEHDLRVEIEQLKRERDSLLHQIRIYQSRLESDLADIGGDASEEERALLEKQRRALEEMRAQLQSDSVSLEEHVARQQAQVEDAVQAQAESMRDQLRQNQEQLELARRQAEELRLSGEVQLRDEMRELERQRRQFEREGVRELERQKDLEQQRRQLEIERDGVRGLERQKDLELQRRQLEIERAAMLERRQNSYMEELRARSEKEFQAQRELMTQEEMRAQEELARVRAVSRQNSVSVQGKGNNIHIGSDRGHSTLIHETDDFSLEIRGKVTFTDDEIDVASISRGGSFKLEDKRNRGERHKLTVRPRSGGLKYSYYYNGKAQDFDAKARAWLADTLPEMLVETAINAEARVSRILAEKGVKGVLDLADSVQSDFAKSVYLKILISKKELSMKEIKRVVKASEAIHSDFHRAQILTAITENREPNAALAEILVDGMKGLSSDFEKRRVLTRVVPITDNTKAMSKLLKAVGTMSSDFEKRQILTQIGTHWKASDLAKVGFFETLETIHSDFEFRQIVVGLTIDESVSRDQMAKLAALSAKKVRSDFELAGILNHLSGYLPLDDEFEKTIGHIHSDHEKSKLLRHLIDRGNLDVGEQETILDCTAQLSSDHERSRVLQAFRNQYELSGSIATRYSDLVQSMSSHYRRRLSDH